MMRISRPTTFAMAVASRMPKSQAVQTIAEVPKTESEHTRSGHAGAKARRIAGLGRGRVVRVSLACHLQPALCRLGPESFGGRAQRQAGLQAAVIGKRSVFVRTRIHG